MQPLPVLEFTILMILRGWGKKSGCGGVVTMCMIVKNTDHGSSFLHTANSHYYDLVGIRRYQYNQTINTSSINSDDNRYDIEIYHHKQFIIISRVHNNERRILFSFV